MRPVFLVLAAFACIHSSLAITEHLLFHELAYGVVSVTAAFAAHQTGGAHEPTFPRSVTSLLDSFPVKELNLTLTRGHWREEWGAGVGPTAPPGATLSVQWHPSIRFDHVHTMWSGVTNALSGLLCTSLSTLAPAQMHSTQETVTPGSLKTLITYGALSQEALCTENLSGLAQMLPCGAKFGTAKLLDPAVLFQSPFHSIRLRVQAPEDHVAGTASVRMHVTYAQKDSERSTVTRALQSPSSLHACPATSAATVALVSQSTSSHAHFLDSLSEQSWRCSSSNGAQSHSEVETAAATPSAGDVAVSVCRDDRTLVATASSMQKRIESPSSESPDQPLASQARMPPTAPVSASLELRGAGEESHQLVLELVPSSSYWSSYGTQTAPDQKLNATAGHSQECSAVTGQCAASWDTASSLQDGDAAPASAGSMCTNTLLPWFVQPWLHTLQVYVDGQQRPLSEVADSLRLEPGERRQRMHVLNFCFHMVPVPQSITVTVEVTTPLLYIDEYPADASRGFDVPATSVHVPQASTLATKHPQAQCMQHLQDAYMNLDAVPQRKDAQWLGGLACQDMHVLHTTGSIVTVAQPDFSMPYIVCALTSSVLAIFSGVLFTRLVERPQQAALRQLKSGNSLKAKLRPFVIILACVILVPYMDPEWRDWVVAHMESWELDPADFGLV